MMNMFDFNKLAGSKTFWTSLASIMTGISLCVSGNVAAGAPMITAAVAAICIRDSIK